MKHDVLRSVYQSATAIRERVAGRLRTVSRFAGKEILTHGQSSTTLASTLGLWSRGFLSRSETLYDFNGVDQSEYITDAMYFRIQQLNGDAVAFTDNKLAFHRLLQHNYPDRLPEILGQIRRGRVAGLDGKNLTQDPNVWLQARVAEHGQVVCKPVDGLRGNDILVISEREGTTLVNGDPASGSLADRFSGQETYLVMEFVKQADYSRVLFPDAVNTIRLITVWDYERGQPFVLGAIQRIGMPASAPVDNCDKGGLSADIDIETGTLSRATQCPDTPSLTWYEEHPTTGAQITGESIPQWDTIRSEVCDMARELGYIPLIAWDIVPTDDGFCILEGNSRPSIVMMQIHGPLLTDERARAFFDHHNV